MNTIRASNSLDPDQAQRSVCKGCYQQMTKLAASMQKKLRINFLYVST